MRRWPFVLMGGVLLLASCACAVGGLFWVATPSYLGARLTGISRVAVGSEQCLVGRGLVVHGPALYITRNFISSDNINSIADWYVHHGWEALTLFIGQSGSLRTQAATHYDLWLAEIVLSSGISLKRNVDRSTEIVMRTTMVLCSG